MKNLYITQSTLNSLGEKHWHQVSISESQGKELQIGRDQLKMSVGGVHH